MTDRLALAILSCCSELPYILFDILVSVSPAITVYVRVPVVVATGVVVGLSSEVTLGLALPVMIEPSGLTMEIVP